jgi:pimeloyl-ACP methyl ester carboxylesterase
MASVGFVFVHGGSHTGACWKPTINLLERPAIATDLPGRGSRPKPLPDVTLADFAEATAEDIDRVDADAVVLVGHSMGGLTIPAAAALRPSVVRYLVFVSATIPPEGVSGKNALGPEIGAILDSQISNGVAAAADEAMSRQNFCNDMDEEQTAFALSGIVPDAAALYETPVSRKNVPPVPRTYVRLDRDQCLIPQFQEQMIANLGDCEVVHLDAGHNVMISRPRELAALLESIATRVEAQKLALDRLQFGRESKSP